MQRSSCLHSSPFSTIQLLDTTPSIHLLSALPINQMNVFAAGTRDGSICSLTSAWTLGKKSRHQLELNFTVLRKELHSSPGCYFDEGEMFSQFRVVNPKHIVTSFYWLLFILFSLSAGSRFQVHHHRLCIIHLRIKIPKVLKGKKMEKKE